MVRICLLALVPFVVQATVRLHAPTAAATPPTAKVQFNDLSALKLSEQKRHMHFGCVSACKPSPIESKCVTACETASYKCIDETGPNETPADTEKCTAKVLKLYEETKGIEKKEEKKDEKKGDKKEAKKESKKAKMFLQMKNIDDDNAEAAEMARLEDQSDKDMGEDDNEAKSGDDSEKSDDEESFVQLKRKNIDDDNAEAAEMARLEDQSDKDMGEDDSEAKSDDSESTDDDSFIQKSRNIDDDNAEAAEMARLEDQSDKDMGEDDSEAKSDDSESSDDESFIQKSRNIDDDNAEAAEMARLEDQSDKDMGEDDNEAKADDSDADTSDSSE